MNTSPLTLGANKLAGLEYATLQIAAGLFALAALSSLFFWFFQKEPLGKSMWLFNLLAFIVLTASVVIRWVNVGHIPYVQLYETLLFTVWSMGLVAIIVDQTSKTRLPGTIVALLSTFTLAYIIQWPEGSRTGSALMPALRSVWLDVHIATAFLSYAGLAISAGCSVVYLFTKNEKVDELSYRLVAFAFPLLGLAIILGAVWASVAWGSYWNWDPKETASLVTWLIYASYLHMRMVYGWKGKQAAILNLIGFLCVVFTWVGLTILSKYIQFNSQHLYSSFTTEGGK
jgi:ABC-type transport system involved in cytochrome c biogenesis permease subunit